MHDGKPPAVTESLVTMTVLRFKFHWKVGRHQMETETLGPCPVSAGTLHTTAERHYTLQQRHYTLQQTHYTLQQRHSIHYSRETLYTTAERHYTLQQRDYTLQQRHCTVVFLVSVPLPVNLTLVRGIASGVVVTGYPGLSGRGDWCLDNSGSC